MVICIAFVPRQALRKSRISAASTTASGWSSCVHSAFLNLVLPVHSPSKFSALLLRQRAKCNAQTLSCLGSRVERRASLVTVVGSHPFLFAPPLRRTSIRPRSAVNPSVKDVEGAPLFWVFRLSSKTAARYRRTRWWFTSAAITGARRATSLSVWMLIKFSILSLARSSNGAPLICPCPAQPWKLFQARSRARAQRPDDNGQRELQDT